ncbi:hypothetical protein LTR78_003402 [Recurvomyces mirabilis]|uniref:Uncharacterized protein n=1 Tax=Recurvomyces mirabilis TaxID=574656 RepID=A0AAE0WRE9_9PEZI|nr:hypothetical protein LTR78_003402 [Recurvomyces mirabilis]KAK5154563.1 hypothetical protein LTS14_006701 [Recurvomyces mirabilis]
MAETILVVGSTGNIGFSAITAALRSKRNVLAVVRSQSSADKLVKYIGSDKGITIAEADVTSDTGVKGVVEKVRAGKLPAFQHVWTSVGGEYTFDKIENVSTERLRRNMNIGFEAGFFAYRDTIKYLREQNNPNSTWTICTGAQGEIAQFVVPAMTQGALFPFCKAAARENEETNVRVNEVYLCYRVENDKDAVEHGVTKASDFANVYEMILDSPDVRSSRVCVENADEDLKKLKVRPFQKI